MYLYSGLATGGTQGAFALPIFSTNAFRVDKQIQGKDKRGSRVQPAPSIFVNFLQIDDQLMNLKAACTVNFEPLRCPLNYWETI